MGWKVDLLLGKGTDLKDLLNFYDVPHLEKFRINPLFIIRKNNPFNLSWNLPFFFGCQRMIQQIMPDCVLLSVRKQAAFHVKRKVSNVRYFYEVHELSYYPGQKIKSLRELKQEQEIFKGSDCIIVTTHALKEILLHPPYEVKKPIAVVPLAVSASTLPPPTPANPLVLMYVGQLYEGQGLPLLLAALAKTKNIHLKIAGGRPEEIDNLKKRAQELSILHRIEFLGFVPPTHLPKALYQAHAFVAPFENKDRMPFVAHTKLFEYSEWGRPIIAPKLPIVEEHFQEGQGTLLFQPDDPLSLAHCMTLLKEESVRNKLQTEISSFSGRFSWSLRASRYSEILSKF
jgi:glycosyltransferase involved in cell wall biosynthesis